jgi:hypothetical protein
LKLLAAITKIADGDPAISGHQQIRRWNKIINIGGRQDEIDDSSCDVLESMQFETKESAFLRFPKTSPILAHQPHAAERMADGDRLGVNQVEFWLVARQRCAGDQQVANQVIQGV